MAAYTEFYCQSGGSNLNAGSTTSDGAAITYASGNFVQSTGVFTVASGNPTSDGVTVGDFASVYADGSGTTGFIGRVTARDSTTITVSTTVKSGSAPSDGTGNRTLKIGGAWQGPNGSDGFPLNFVESTMINASSHPVRVNLKNSATYSISSGITRNSLSGLVIFQGYSSSPGDGGKATIDGSTNAIALFASSSDRFQLWDLVFSNNGTTGNNTGVSLTGYGVVCRRVVVHDVRGAGFNVGTNTGVVFDECEAYACNGSNTSNLGGYTISTTCALINCISHDNVGSNSLGFRLQGSTSHIDLIGCIADTNGAHGFIVNSISNSSNVLLNGCDSYNNGGDGLRITQGGTSTGCRVMARNSNFIKNGGYGANRTNSIVGTVMLVSCGFGAGTQANSSGSTTGLTDVGDQNIDPLTYANDVTPWVDPANGDFRINLSAAKGTGRGAYTQTAASYSGTVSYPDVGAAQHQDSGGTTFVYQIME